MRRRLFLSLSMVLVMCLAACSGSKSNEKLVSTKPEEQVFLNDWETASIDSVIIDYLKSTYDIGDADIYVSEATCEYLSDNSFKYWFELHDANDTGQIYTLQFIKKSAELTANDNLDEFDCSFTVSREESRTVPKRPTVVVCETDDLESTTSLNTDGQSCTIEYVSVSKNKELTSYDKGPLSGSIDKDRYDRIIAVLNTIGDNRAEFSAKAEQFSQVNKAYPSFDTLFDSMLVWYALYANHDDKTTDDAAKALWEADNYLADIEQIAEHDYVADNYVFTCENVDHVSLPDGAKAGIADDGRYVITDYYDAWADPELRIVDYQTYVDTWNFYTNHAELPFDDPDQDYAIYAYIDDSAHVDVWVDSMTVNNGSLNATIFTDSNGVMASGNGKFLVIPVPKGTEIGETEYIQPVYKESPMYDIPCDKPVVYLYNYDGDVNVQVEFVDNGELTCTYPEYGTNGWTVTARPDGHLLGQSGMVYRYLYWEGRLDTKWSFDEGFCVRGIDTAAFLEDVLKAQGLNDDEINEFIIYWLPQMQDNEYNVISFQTETYNRAVKLNVDPKPDTMIRVFMAWYPAETKVDIMPQRFAAPFKRVGKTVVEWGGSKVSP